MGHDINEYKDADTLHADNTQPIGSLLIRRLYYLNSYLADEISLDKALHEIVAVATELIGTDRGCIQLVNKEYQRLEVAAYCGYDPASPFLKHCLKAGFESAFNVGHEQRDRVLIEDTETAMILQGTKEREIALAESIRAVQFTPIIDHKRKVIGVLSTQFRQPYRPAKQELQLIDLLTWTAVEFLERHVANRALHTKNEQFYTLASASSDVVFRMSPNWIEMRHLKGQAFVPDTPKPSRVWLDMYIPPDDQPHVTERIRAAIRTKSVFELEHRIICTNGALGRVLSRAVPMLNEDGEIIEWFGTARDVTDRRATEETLRQKNENQAFLLKLNDVLRPLTTPSAIRQAAAQLLGAQMKANRVAYFEVADGSYAFENNYSDGVPPITNRYPIESFGSALYESCHNRCVAFDYDTDASPALSLVQKAEFASIQTRAYVSAPLFENGEFSAGLIIHCTKPRQWTDEEINLVRDVAERAWIAAEKECAKQSIIKSEAKYRRLFDSMDQGYCIVEVLFDDVEQPLDACYVEVNQAFEKHTGLRGAAGKTIRELTPDIESKWLDIYARVARTGESQRFVEDSAAFNRCWDLYIFREGEANNNRIAILFSDITERHRAEQALQEADRRKDEFLATLAHELRNPLAPLRNGLAIMRQNNPQTRAKAQAIMERQLDQLIHLVDDLLDISRISRGKVELRLAPTELTAIVQEAVEATRPRMNAAGHNLRVTLPDAAVRLHADGNRLTQVITNLLTNACKYTPPGGAIEISLQEHGDSAVVRVRDNGMGIAADRLTAIFDLFRQNGQPEGQVSEGLGIGLTLVKQMVELHGGSVVAHSDGSGLGSEFVVRLPLTANESAPTTGQ